MVIFNTNHTEPTSGVGRRIMAYRAKLISEILCAIEEDKIPQIRNVLVCMSGFVRVPTG